MNVKTYPGQTDQARSNMQEFPSMLLLYLHLDRNATKDHLGELDTDWPDTIHNLFLKPLEKLACRSSDTSYDS